MRGQISLEFLFTFLLTLTFVGFLTALLIDFHSKLKEQEEVVRLTIELENAALEANILSSAGDHKHVPDLQNGMISDINTLKIINNDKILVVYTIKDIARPKSQHI